LIRLVYLCATTIKNRAFEERTDMKLPALALAAALLLPLPAQAEENAEVVKAIEAYMDFSGYGSSIIFA